MSETTIAERKPGWIWDGPKPATWYPTSDELKAEIYRLRTALRDCMARAGNPDPAEGCRQVIATAQKAMEGKE